MSSTTHIREKIAKRIANQMVGAAAGTLWVRQDEVEEGVRQYHYLTDVEGELFGHIVTVVGDTEWKISSPVELSPLEEMPTGYHIVTRVDIDPHTLREQLTR